MCLTRLEDIPGTICPALLRVKGNSCAKLLKNSMGKYRSYGPDKSRQRYARTYASMHTHKHST